jgi:hypothetical protein
VRRRRRRAPGAAGGPPAGLHGGRPGGSLGEEGVRELLDLADSGLPHASAADLGRPGPRGAGSPPETRLRGTPSVGGEALIRVWEWRFPCLPLFYFPSGVFGKKTGKESEARVVGS